MKKNLKDKKSLNIAMLGHKRIPSREGGIEIVVEELATRMVTLGHKVTCYNRSGHHVSGKDFDGGKRKAYKGVRLKSVLTLDKKGLAAMTASVSGAICAAFGKYDVVQRAKWGKLASTYIMMGEKCAVKCADEIIVLSKGVQDYFKETYGRETKFIPNGVNRPVIRKPELIKEKFGLEKDDYILFLGRLVPEKGIAYLIETFKKVNTDKKLVIAGGSSDTDEFASQLKEMAKDDDRIIFTGFVQGQLLDELYSNAYIYSLPSDLEGMPLSLLEAMSYGNCCLVSDIDECASVVEDKAIVFKKSDVADLQSKLQKACDDVKQVQKYKDEAADYICEKYNWDDVVKRTLELYRD